ncbi:unnamed protein product [Rhizophagus irregularis]|nr:unnamed protein product [Rhizophagus irregularis]
MLSRNARKVSCVYVNGCDIKKHPVEEARTRRPCLFTLPLRKGRSGGRGRESRWSILFCTISKLRLSSDEISDRWIKRNAKTKN